MSNEKTMTALRDFFYMLSTAQAWHGRYDNILIADVAKIPVFDADTITRYDLEFERGDEFCRLPIFSSASISQGLLFLRHCDLYDDDDDLFTGSTEHEEIRALISQVQEIQGAERARCQQIKQENQNAFGRAIREHLDSGGSIFDFTHESEPRTLN